MGGVVGGRGFIFVPSPLPVGDVPRGVAGFNDKGDVGDRPDEFDDDDE